jgi:GAF domain-containing protein/HAMP domain-containing protein
MNLPSTEQTLRLVAWFFAWAELVLALYLLVLNAWHTANRHVSASLFLTATSTFAVSLILGVQDAAQAAWPTYLLAALTPVTQVMILLVTVVLLKPEWLRGRWRPVWWLAYGLCFIPPLLTVLDVRLGTRLWYTGLDVETYAGGFVPQIQYTAGSFATPMRIVYFYLPSLLALALSLYVVLLDKKSPPITHHLARFLLVPLVISLIVWVGLSGIILEQTGVLVTSIVFGFVYAYATFQYGISEQRLQRGRLRPRLTLLILSITVPIFVAIVTLVGIRAGPLMEEDAAERLEAANRSLAANVSVWLDLNVKSLQQLVSLPDIISMDAARQKPLLEAMAAAYPHMYLVSTTDLNGINVARNDDVAPKDYSDRPWFLEARNGAPLTFQTLIGRTSGVPSLVASMPIRDESGVIVGVGMFATVLTDITREVQAGQMGDTGLAYIVDAQNQAVAHPNPTFSAELRDLSAYPPVFTLRGGTRGLMDFTDEEDTQWRAYVSELDNGWGIVVQQPVSELLSTLQVFERSAWFTIAGGTLLLAIMISLAMHQAFQPIVELTETATAIAAGDLTRTAPVGSKDELGVLAHAFNSMTDQLRGLISGLEQRVAERTAELGQRAVQLQAAADVSRVATSELNLDELMNRAVTLIRERFDLYYAGLFLLDDTGRWAELRAGTGEAGRLMVTQGHRLEVGSNSMVGWCTAYGQARIALDVGEEAIIFDNPLLPNTHSEMALPLVARERVIGALDVQSMKERAFGQEDVTVLQTLADQIAVAIDNARLFAEAQERLAEVQAIQRHYLRTAWADFAVARAPSTGYRYVAGIVEPDPDAWLPAMADTQRHDDIVVVSDDDGTTTLSLPITLRGETVGILGFKRDGESEWTDDDIAVARAVADQVALTLDNVRLFDEARRRAQREALVRGLTDKMRRINDVDAILEMAVQELGKTLGSARAFIRLTASDGDGHE